MLHPKAGAHSSHASQGSLLEVATERSGRCGHVLAIIPYLISPRMSRLPDPLFSKKYLAHWHLLKRALCIDPLTPPYEQARSNGDQCPNKADQIDPVPEKDNGHDDGSR